MKLDLVKYDRKFLSHSGKWLNNPEIKYLTQTPDFTEEGQNKWFESLNGKTDYKIWGITVDNLPIGACGIKNINDSDCEYWGYIGEKNYWGKGCGKSILDRMIEEAVKFNLTSIWLKVIKDNIRAIKLYESKGFVVENEEGGTLIMRKLL